MKTFLVHTRATVRRIRRVEAENEKEAEAASFDAVIETEEDETEVTTDIVEDKSE